MIEFIKYFFRHNPDGYTNMPLNIIRIFFIVGLIFAIMRKSNDKLLKPLLLLGLVIQGLLFIWYLGKPEILFKEGLPLYHCRIASIMMAISYFLKKKRLAKFFAWMGVIGAITVILIPDASPYVWPHVTNLTFIVSHFLLLVNGILIVKTINERLHYKKILKYAFSMNSVLLIVNILSGGNYGYLMRTPSMMNLELPMPLIFFAINLLITAIVDLAEMGSIKASKSKFAKSFVN